MQFSLQIEGMFGLTWQRWQWLAQQVEQLGFAGLFRSDHFLLGDMAHLDALEAIVSLTYLASHTQRIYFGTLVAPVSFRDPVMLARQAMAIDDLSGGRMVLGVGAGWMEQEHTAFGYDLLSTDARLDRFAEGLEVITQLIRNDEPVTFTGKYYQLREARLLPRPQRKTPILVGGNGPKRTLPLVARYADIWNCVTSDPALFRERSALLDDLLRAAGRAPGSVRRTVMIGVVCWMNEAERNARLQPFRNTGPMFADVPAPALIGWLRENFGTLLGTPDEILPTLQQFADAGAEEIMLQWTSLDDLEGIAALAEHILPHFAQ